MKKVAYILLVNLVLLIGYTISEVMNQFYIRCYVEVMTSDPMGDTDLSQYEPQGIKHIDVLVVEYTDTDWNNYYTKSYDDAKIDWQNAINNLNTVFKAANIEFTLADGDYRRKTIQTGAGANDLSYLFTDCSIDPLNDIKAYPGKYLRIASMPLNVKVTYNQTDYTVAGSVDKIFGSCIYIERDALGYDLQYYVAQSLGLYDTDETHFGTDVRDFLDDTEINQPDNLMNRENSGTGLTPNQIQRLNWALETQPDLKKLIEANVEFANKINSETVSGALFYDNHSVSSGETVKLLDSKQYEIGTQDQVITYNSKDYQHFRWNEKADDYLIKRNTRIVKTSNKETKQHAEFAPLEVINIDLPSEATFYLRDPWYLTNGQQPNEFREVSGSNFDALLDINPSFDSQYPIYEIKQPASHQRNVHNENVTYYFTKWTGTDVNYNNASNNQTKVVFEKSNASIQANYKGHLASSIARATGYNNGRRIYKDNNGTIYMVYEDDGDIWLTYSTDDGKTWNKESCIDSHYDISINPSIAGADNFLFVTWYDQTTSSIILRKYDISNAQWAEEELVGNYFFTYDVIIPAPSVAVYLADGTKYNIIIAFNYEKYDDNDQPTGISEVDIFKNTNQDFNQWDLILGPFDGSNPSISAYENELEVGLVWDHNGKIFFKRLDSDGNWSSTKQISDDLWYHEDNCKPNISFTHGVAHIVWEGFHAITEMPTGYYRYYDSYSDILSDLTEMPCGGADVHNLSVSSNNSIGNNNDIYDYTVFYEADGIEKVDQTGNNFTQENFGDGKYPNITEHDRSRAVWTKYNDAPYFLKTDYVESNNGGGVSPIIINPGPVIDYVISANNNNGVEGDVTLSVENVILNHDTVYFDNALNSQTMSVSQNYVPLEMDLKVRFHNVNTGLNDEDILYNVVFKDSTDETFLTNLKYKELPSPNGNDFEKFLKVTTIVNLAGKTGKLHLKFNGVQPALVTKQLKVTGSGSLNKEISHKMIIPKTFALHQNFPNPFNPTTHITVDLPEDAKVHLSVYNVNGQKVKELMSGCKAAGTYEIIFDGENLASGVYIYRLTTDKGFVQSKKMMLIR